MPKIGGKNMPYEEQPNFQDQNTAVQESNEMGR